MIKQKPQVRRIDGKLFFLGPKARASDFMVQTLIDFANEGPEPRKFTRQIFDTMDLGHDYGAAHALVVDAFDSLSAKGALKRRTESEINGVLARNPARVIHTLDGEVLSEWVARSHDGLMALCAYVIATIVGYGLSDNMCRCPLSECGKFHWRPITRGRRHKYCCELHRQRGSKREHRGQPL
jgi:hypothetical protein